MGNRSIYTTYPEKMVNL